MWLLFAEAGTGVGIDRHPQQSDDLPDPSDVRCDPGSGRYSVAPDAEAKQIAARITPFPAFSPVCYPLKNRLYP